MSDDPEWMGKLRWKEEYLEEWLERHKGAEEIADDVQKNLEFTRWQIEVVETRPDEADEVVFSNLTVTLDSDVAHLEAALPMMPIYDKEQFLGASAFTSSGTVSVFDYAGRVGDLGTPDAVEYSGTITDKFRGLQKKYDRPAEVRALIERTGNPQTLRRFDAAYSSYQAHQRGAAQRTAVANDIRNLIKGVKGDLWEAARRQPKENMTWEIMARRLARGGSEGLQADELVNLKKSHASLVERLSEVLKDREAGSLTNVDNLWANVQDLLIALVGLIDVDALL